MQEGTIRVVIEKITPSIDDGRFPIRRIPGETVSVEADVFADGHDEIRATLLVYRGTHETPLQWQEYPMTHIGNDRWNACFTITGMKRHRYAVRGTVDRFATLSKDFLKKLSAGEATTVDRDQICTEIEKNLATATGADRRELLTYMERLAGALELERIPPILEEKRLKDLMTRNSDEGSTVTQPSAPLEVDVVPSKARFSSWYEFFPRSTCNGRMGGTLKDACERLPEIARMGFDVVYVPPVHPIGTTDRKGPDNTLPAGPEDPGCPWAIGASEGGHKTIHPDLGTLEDFRDFVKTAGDLGMEVAMDLAFQCSRDHPYIASHPEWFRWRPDGSIQYAENPPKKYQDVVPFNFETPDWKDLWQELKKVTFFWMDQGIRIFRVDNPHTKPFRFWNWLIAEAKKRDRDVIFLAEAFTRPKVMRRLAREGFTQSYTYFTWRNSAREMRDYLVELTQTELVEYFQPNFWPNTPDILPEFLQIGGRPAFVIRLVLAATLSSCYGIYGPPFELLVFDALPGREEYHASEKYEIRDWNWDQPGNLKDFISRVNTIRKDNPALQSTRNLKFLDTDNENILFYLKENTEGNDLLLIGVSLDPFTHQSCHVNLPLEKLGIDSNQSYLLHDLLGDEKFVWQGGTNAVGFDPAVLPAKIFRIHRRMRREEDFDYFM
ncbi:MAG: alpha-1,4-glucan--maltose-1-phosphate maltosyltransferase [Thermovirgaceae bacterium]